MNVSTLLLAASVLITSANVVAEVPLIKDLGLKEQKAKINAAYLNNFREAAIAVYQKDGNWPNSITTLKSSMGSLPQRSNYVDEPIYTVNSDGSVSIQIDTGTKQDASALASLGRGVSYRITGTKVTLVVPPPQGTNLRSVYKDQVNSEIKSSFSIKDELSLNGNKVINGNKVTTELLSSPCLSLGSSKICENSSGSLDISTDLASLTSNAQVNGSIAADVVNVVNKLKSNEMSVSDLISSDTLGTDLIISAANFDNAQIDVLDAVVANMKAVAIQDLNVNGLSQLAGLLATEATLSSLAGVDINVSRKAVMNTLKSSGLLAGNAAINSANIEAMVANIASIVNLKNNLLEAQRLLSQQGVLTEIAAATANVNTLVLGTGDSAKLNAETFKSKLAELGIAVIKTTLSVDDLKVKEIKSDFTNFTSLKADLGTVNTLKANVINTITTKTGSLVVDADATVGGNVNVAGVASSNDLIISKDFNVTNILTSLRLLVNNDMVIANALRSKGLVVKEATNVSKTMTVTTALAAKDINVQSSMSTKDFTVLDSVNVHGLATAKSVTSKSAKVNGVTSAKDVQSNSFTVTTQNTANLNSDQVNTKSLIGLYTASFQDVTVNSLTASSTNVGKSVGLGLVLTTGLVAKNASFATLNVSNRATVGGVIANSGQIKGDATVEGNIVALNLNTVSLNSALAVINTINASDIFSSGLITGGTVKTSSGVSLASVNNIYVDHDGRILTIEQFRSECISNWVYACSGTLPRLDNTICSGCVGTSNSSGSFAATASARIFDCPAGCNYSWSAGTGISKSSCGNGSISPGQIGTVSCSFVSSPQVLIGTTQSSTVNLDVTHSGKSSIKTGNTYPVSWTFIGERPSVAIGCTGCDTKQFDSGIFNATLTAAITSCSAGCAYQWISGSGIRLANCPSGNILPGGGHTAICKIEAEPELKAPEVRNSSVKINVINSLDASLKEIGNQIVSWESKLNAAPKPVPVISTSCSNCVDTHSGNGIFTATINATISSCEGGCTYAWALASALKKGVCSDGTVNSGLSKSVSCEVTSTTAVSPGSTLNSNVSITATNISDTSKNASKVLNVSWKNNISEPIERVMAGCFVDTYLLDEVELNFCSNKVKNDPAKAVFSVGDSYSASGGALVFTNNAEWSVVWSGCNNSTSTSISMVCSIWSSGEEGDATASLTVTHKPTGAKRIFNVKAKATYIR
jgi:hypothetical protein